MRLRVLLLSFALIAASAAAQPAFAQAKGNAAKREHQAMLPVWNHASGKLEAVLLLEPASDGVGSRLRFGDATLDAAFGLQAGDSLGVVCDRGIGLAGALGSLANNCQLGVFDQPGSRRASGSATLSRGDSRLGLNAGTARDTLPSWLSPGGKGGSAQVDVNDLTVFAERNIGREGVVSIAGTFAKATLMTPAEALDLGFPDSWSSRSVQVGGGYGDFGLNIVGHVVDTPDQPKWEGLGLGITWRTPWSGQLTVGADNVVTRGRNPFSPRTQDGQDEGTVPYVRYEQDL